VSDNLQITKVLSADEKHEDAVLPGAAYVALAIEAALRSHEELAVPSHVTGFSLKDVAITNALAVPDDDRGVELMTAMELSDASVSSYWRSFSVSSVQLDTNKWTEHCTGHVRLETEPRNNGSDLAFATHCARLVDTKVWYDKFLEIGLVYGPTFQPLSNILMDRNSHTAQATVNLTPSEIKDGGSRYALHPASLDGMIQLGLIACYDGSAADADTAFVPVNIPRLYISNTISSTEAVAVSCGVRHGIRSAHLDLELLDSDGHALLSATGIRCLAFSRSSKVDDLSFTSPFTRLVWKPDVGALSTAQAQQIYPPPTQNIARVPAWTITNRVAHLVVLSIAETIKQVDEVLAPEGDIGHFFDWVRRMGKQDHSPAMEEGRVLLREGRLLQRLEELVKEASHVVEVQVAKLLHDNIIDILYQRRSGIEVILNAELLTPLYQHGLLMTGIYPQLSRVLSDIGHCNPNLRIFEIGGGTGGATRIAMKAFAGPNGIKSYQDYTFTDISAGFLSSARESMAEFRDVHFSVFDVEGNPADQGFGADYDLVIACQVLHATSNMHRTLTHCRNLLRPGGKLLMVETNENFIVPGVVVGTFTGYWAGVPDGRVDAPFQSLNSWEVSLKKAGFSGLDLVLDDFPIPHNTTSVILSTRTDDELVAPRIKTAVQLYIRRPIATGILEALQHEFTSRDNVVNIINTPTDIAENSRVIAIYPADYTFDQIDDAEFLAFQTIVQKASRLVVLTNSGVVTGRAADAAVLQGLLRVLQNENPACQYASIDIDSSPALSNSELVDLARSIATVESGLPDLNDLRKPDEQARDSEFSWHNGALWISRFVTDAGFHATHGLSGRNIKPELQDLAMQGPLRARFETPGLLKSLCFVPDDSFSQPLPEDYLDVQVHAWGLSASDLDQWTGKNDRDYLACEYAGVVKAVGNGVGEMKVGDPVWGLCKGSFGNVARVPAALSRQMQAEDDFSIMAAVPLTLATAIYVVQFMARIRPGDRFLLGDVDKALGAAIINLAQSQGADVFAIATNSEHAQYLSTNAALAADRIIPSPERLPQVGKFTVIVGRFISGDSIQISLAPRGTVISLGGPPFSGPLPPLASYHFVDSHDLLDVEPAFGAELMRAVEQRYRQQSVSVQPHLVIPDPAGISSAVTHLENHKVVVNFAASDCIARIVPTAPQARFHAESWYLVTGGLGGLGQSLIRWMADRGARYIALLSRRTIAEIEGAEAFVNLLRQSGVQLAVYSCDVSDQQRVSTVFQQLAAERAIRGVLHAAVSYLDISWEKTSAARWRDGLAAKVRGTKNLHEATLGMDLDFFVMTTSALSLFAFPTQGAYTAANNFQDAFARYRRRLGLPASTISFSLVKSITKVGTSTITLDLFERQKTLTVSEEEFLTMIEPAFQNNSTSFSGAGTTTPTTDSSWPGQSVDPLSAANLHTYLDPRALSTRLGDATSKPRWAQDARVSHIVHAARDAQRHSASLTSVDDETNQPDKKNTPSQIRATFEACIREGAAARSTTVEFVQTAILHAVAEMLYVDVEGLDGKKSVADVGVDSLIAAELRNWFLAALGAKISMLDLLDPMVSIADRAEEIVGEALEEKEG
jgi:NADPH:quinone reductase-like Zn-dependent oxidoreductase/SAM-dependent methyltransferase